MAYNLQPLITLLQQILDPEQTRWIVGRKKPELKSLLEKTASLQQILENSSVTTKIEISLESQIRDAAHKAEDIIESQMVDRMRLTPKCVTFTLLTPDVQQINQEFDSIIEEVEKLIDGKTTLSGSSSHDVQHAKHELESLKLVEVEANKMPSDSSWSGAPDFSSSKNDLVGVDADLLQLKDRLTNMQSKLEIIPIVGMGGIGKSTLALNLYHDPLIVEHFIYRGWAVVSQVHNMRSILLSLLRRPNEKLSNELIGLEVSKLKDILYKRLFGRRYLIVLDDIWSIITWDEIRRYLPNNNNGSRILITTRESSLASDANWSMQHHVRLLDDSSSGDLLRQVVFGKEDCPHELQEIGEKIASDCGGLPLAIHVIGGLLSKVERSRDAWEHISSDVKVALVESNKQFSDILSLSYNHLPIHLKPCFLYMGAFPEDYEIKASTLMPMLIGEGFVKSNEDRSLEEEVEDYLKALVERNLLLVPRKKSNGKPMRYAIHDLLRDLCIRKANEEKFLHVKNSPDVTFSNQRRVSVQFELKDLHASQQQLSLARSFIYIENEIISPIFFILRLVKVLDIMKIVFEKFPEEILQLVNLRCLAFSCNSGLPIGISRLSNLQTLISKQDYGNWTSDLWEISELRHLRLESLIKIEEEYKMKFVHKKLQTIHFMKITPSLIRSGFFETIPNVVKLGILYIDPPCIEVDLSHLHKLETLSCDSKLDRDGSHFLPKLRLPCNLRKLTLDKCVIYGSFLTTLCALPSLEALKIWKCVFENEEADEEWEVIDEFHSLQHLHLGGLNVARWRADETNFPRLRHLRISNCLKLDEIPSAIGDIPTLQLIEIWGSSASVVASAQEIQKVQQEDYDNDDLKLLIE